MRGEARRDRLFEVEDLELLDDHGAGTSQQPPKVDMSQASETLNE